MKIKLLFLITFIFMVSTVSMAVDTKTYNERVKYVCKTYKVLFSVGYKDCIKGVDRSDEISKMIEKAIGKDKKALNLYLLNSYKIGLEACNITNKSLTDLDMLADMRYKRCMSQLLKK